MKVIDHFDAPDIIAVLFIIGGFIIYFFRPDQEIITVITMIAGFYFGRNIVSRKPPTGLT